MVELDGVNYYTVSELLEMMLEENPIVTEVQKKMYEVYGNFNLYLAFIQSKLYSARDKKAIRYIEFQKKGSTKYYAFAIKDILDFLNKPCAKHIMTGLHRNIKIIEAENQ